MKIQFLIDNGYKYVEMDVVDLQLLLFLNEQGTLSLPQTYQFHSLVKDKPLHENSFRNKMARWAEKGLIERQTRYIQKGVRLVLIKLTNVGATFLEKLGLIKKTTTKKRFPTQNVDHNLAIRQIVIEALEFFKEKYSQLGYIANNGEYYIFLKESAISYNIPKNTVIKVYKDGRYNDDIIKLDPFGKYSDEKEEEYFLFDTVQSINPYKKGDLAVIEDWLFRIYDEHYHFEVDTGTEKITLTRENNFIIDTNPENSIEGKLARYQKALRDSTDRHYFIFASLDDSTNVITTTQRTSKKSRLRNTKLRLSLTSTFDEFSHNVYFVSIGQVKDLIRSIENSKKDDFIECFETLFNKISQSEEQQLSLQVISNHEEFKKIDQTDYPIEQAFLFKNKASGRDTIFITVYMEIGNIHPLKQIDIYTQNLHSITEKNVKILGIYVTKKELMDDILTWTKATSSLPLAIDMSNVYFLSLEELQFGDYYYRSEIREGIKEALKQKLVEEGQFRESDLSFLNAFERFVNTKAQEETPPKMVFYNEKKEPVPFSELF